MFHTNLIRIASGKACFSHDLSKLGHDILRVNQENIYKIGAKIFFNCFQVFLVVLDIIDVLYLNLPFPSNGAAWSSHLNEDKLFSFLCLFSTFVVEKRKKRGIHSILKFCFCRFFFPLSGYQNESPSNDRCIPVVATTSY